VGGGGWRVVLKHLLKQRLFFSSSPATKKNVGVYCAN